MYKEYWRNDHLEDGEVGSENVLFKSVYDIDMRHWQWCR